MLSTNAAFTDVSDPIGRNVSGTKFEHTMFEVDKADAAQPFTDPGVPPMTRSDPLRPVREGPYKTPADKAVAASYKSTRKQDSAAVLAQPVAPSTMEAVERKHQVEKDAMPIEQKWIDFHAGVLSVLNPMNVNSKGLKSLSRTVHGLGGRKSAPFMTAFSSGVFGVDYNSGAKIVFNLSLSTLPFHVCSGLALVSDVVKGVPTNDIYSLYTAQIRKVRSIVKNNGKTPDDYVETIKRVLAEHAKTTVRFLREFHSLNAFGMMGVNETKTFFRSWINELTTPLKATIKQIEVDLAAKHFAKQLYSRSGDNGQAVDAQPEDDSDEESDAD